MFKFTISAEEIEALEQKSFEGEIHVIEHTGREFNKAIEYLKAHEILGFDTETRPVFTRSKKNMVSLLQLSAEGHSFLFRIKKMSLNRKLADILSDPKIMKIGAAVNGDINGLRRYRNFIPGGFVDLQEMVHEYGIKDQSLKKMCANILGFSISKSQQLSNWEAEELSEAQKKYASTDAWVCELMYKKLLQSEKKPLTWDQLHPEIKEKQDDKNNIKEK